MVISSEVPKRQMEKALRDYVIDKYPSMRGDTFMLSLHAPCNF
jgi:hypothetical protein